MAISSERSDQLTLIPLLETMQEKLGEAYADVTADAGYESEDCEGCPYKKSCTRAKSNRKLQVSKKFIRQRALPLQRITSGQGILLRMNRSIQSEGAFGVLKQDYGFRQFLLRGYKKVFTEVLLVAMSYNLNKLHAKIQHNRTGRQLFEKLLN